MEGKSRASWWLVGLLGAIVLILLACIVAAFVGGLVAWFVAKEEWRTPPYSYAPQQPTVMPAVPEMPRIPEIPFGMMSGAAVIDKVVPGSPAEQAGLQRGDVILAVNGEEIGPNNDLREALNRYRPGDTVSLEIRRWRTGQTETVQVHLGSHPDDPRRAYLGIEYHTMPFMGSPGD
ncbi:MAG: S1C family serine protease [Anaerolineae bacterium]